MAFYPPDRVHLPVFRVQYRADPASWKYLPFSETCKKGHDPLSGRDRNRLRVLLPGYIRCSRRQKLFRSMAEVA